MPPRRRKRIDPAAFNLPVEQIKQGLFSDSGFARAREIIQRDKRTPIVTLQFSGTHAGWVSGIDEAVALLKLCVDDWSALTVHALYEGDRYEDWDTVLTVEGPYESFVHLETLCIGALARRTRVCTNAKLICLAAPIKPVMYFGAREDVLWSQPGDGFAAMVGGVKLVSSDAQASLFGGKTVSAVPHPLIAAYGGDTVKAAKRFAETFESVDVIAFVDYDNDCAKTAVDVARALEGRLWGVRLETADTMVDKSVLPLMGAFRPTGVNAPLIWNVRNALDAEGFGDVKIIVSSGIDASRIQAYEEDGVPLDAYGVSSALFEGRFEFTADVVAVNGKPESRAGRKAHENPKLERVK